MENTPNSRLALYLKSMSITRTVFAEKLGTSQPTISAILSGSRPLSKGMLARIGEKYSNLNIDWLLTGEGDMLRIPQADKSSGEESVNIGNMQQKSDFRLVPLINIDSVGGIHSDNITTPSEQYIIRMMPFTEAREGDVAIIQSGTSMYPTIPPGSALLIREVIGWKEYFGYGGIYVIWLKDGRRITKEIRRYDADPKNYVWCVSYNPDVADEELPKSMIRGVWKVVKYIADFGW